MRYQYGLAVLLLFTLAGISCKKGNTNQTDGCSPDAVTKRYIVNKQAVVKVTATYNGIYLVEQGSIDTRLIPCNLPMEFLQNDLQVTVSGEVKPMPNSYGMPCCSDNLVITKISR